MIKVFIPQIKGREKTSIRGFWRDTSNNKIYYDYLKIIQVYNFNNDIAEDLKKKYNQEALFYVKDNTGYCYYNSDKTEILKRRVYTEIYKTDKIRSIREALRIFQGVTIYKIGNKYFKEIFY